VHADPFCNRGGGDRLSSGQRPHSAHRVRL